MLADPTLDAVAIVTPVSTHYALAAAAIEAGKHVFVEKPLAASSSEAVDLIERADRAGVVLFPGHTFLYSPPVVKIKEILDSGHLGEVYFISMSRVNLGLHQQRRQRRLGSRPARLLDPPLLAGTSARQRSRRSRGTASCPTRPTSRSSTCVSHRASLPTSSSRGSRRASCGGRRSSAPSGCSSTTISARSRSAIFDSGATLRDPETFGEFRLTYRTGDIVSPQIAASEPLALEVGDFCAAVLDHVEPRSSAAGRTRRDSSDRGSRRVT